MSNILKDEETKHIYEIKSVSNDKKVSRKTCRKSHLMNFSEFIEKKALFGGFPSKEKVQFLENMGVIHFVNLTMQNEKNTTPYQTKYNVITYPIKDMSVPTLNRQFSNFIFHLVNIIRNLQEHQYMYIHCRGGHGRAGMIVACILIVYLNTTAMHALHLTNNFHNQRAFMRERWRKIGSPQTSLQKRFVHSFSQYIKQDLYTNEISL